MSSVHEKVNSHFLWVYIFFLVSLSSACKEYWRLDTQGGDDGQYVTFMNSTLPTMTQSLSWMWRKENSEIWEVGVIQHYQLGYLSGSVIYRNTDSEVHELILWKLEGDHFSSDYNRKLIPDKSWSITWNGAKMEFHSDEIGIWEFKIFDKFIVRNNESLGGRDFSYLPNAFGEEFEGHLGGSTTWRSRTNTWPGSQWTKINDQNQDEETPRTILNLRKRSEPETLFDENPEGNDTIQQAGVMDCIHDFLFGEGDPVTGRSVGVFTRVKNWFKSIVCRIKGDCESEVPSMIPPVTMPPYNPDAESAPGITPSSADNDVLKK